MTVFTLHILKMNLIAAVMICVSIVLAGFTKRKYSSKWKYYMWLMVMVFLLIPVDFSANSPLKLQINRLESEDEGFAETVQVSGISGKSTDIRKTAITVSEEKKNSSLLLPIQKMSLYEGLRIFRIIWIAGIVFWGIIRTFFYYFSLHNMRRWSYAVRDRRFLQIYYAQCRKKGIKHPPRLLMCEGLSSPMLAGLKHAGLYLPKNSYKTEELEFIFSHELSHYCRHDLWYKMLLIVVTTIYWFNPALYLMQREAEKDIENLCDGSMVVKYSMDKRMKYGQLLLKIAASQNHVPYLSVSLNNGKKVFKDRILYMKNLKSLKERLSLAVILGGIMVGSHMLVGISIQNIPVYAQEQTDSLPVREEQTDRNVVQMIPVSEEEKENQITSELQKEPENTEIKNEESENYSQDLSETGNSEIVNETDESVEGPKAATSEDTQEEVSLTDEVMLVYAADWDGATYLYKGTDGNWYDIYGNLFYGDGSGSWSGPDGSTYLDYDPNQTTPAGTANQTNIVDDSGYNVGTLYQDEDGVWKNGAGGIFEDNGDGTFTGPDGMTWYEN